MYLNFEAIMVYYLWISNIPGYNPYIKSLSYEIKNILKHNTTIYNKIGFIYRSSSKFVYDIKDKDKKNNDLTKLLAYKIIKNKLGKLKEYFEEFDIENKNTTDISNFCKNKQILISPHWHDLVHLYLLPPKATIIELTYSKHWYCDPVCEDHLSGKKEYDEDCKNRKFVLGNQFNNIKNTSSINNFYNIENNELYYHKADYHNLALICCKNWTEFQIDYGKDYTLDKGNYNPVYINELYIDTDKLVDLITKIYKE